MGGREIVRLYSARADMYWKVVNSDLSRCRMSMVKYPY